MKTFNKMAAQGDIAFIRIDKLPQEAVEVKPSKCMEYVLSHSETGHKHIIKATPDVQFFAHANDNMKAYLVVNNDGPMAEHTRGFDTHEPIMFKQGIYEIRRQVEWSPEGWRVALD
jgi:hypothetical protein